MLIISHRGNINGPISKFENQPFYIQDALDKGLNVEVDVWNINNVWYLGHDEPKYPTTMNFLNNNRLWCHAKNLDALFKLTEYNNGCKYFWHQTDNFTLTSNGFIWTYPNKLTSPLSILVLEDEKIPENFNGYGICTDYPKF